MNYNLAKIEVSLQESFKKWLEITLPFHKLTNQEMDVLATILYHRYIISQNVKSDIYIDRILFDKDTKKQIKQDLGINPQVFLNVISNLRKKGILTESSVNKRLVPKIEKDTMRIVFDLKIKENEG